MRLGLFLSEAGGALGKVVDVPWLASQYRELAAVEVLPETLSRAALNRVAALVTSAQLDGVVLAGESPRYYQSVPNAAELLETLGRSGINGNRIGYANLLQHVAGPHRNSAQQATQKAKLLIDVALARLRWAPAVAHVDVAPRRAVAIFGTTFAGMMAAAQLLRRGYRVTILDHTPEWRALDTPGAVTEELLPTLSYVRDHTLARFYVGTLHGSYGRAGDFALQLDGGEVLRVGGLLLAVDHDPGYCAALYPHLRVDRDKQGNFTTRPWSVLSLRSDAPGVVVIPPQRRMALSEMALHVDSAVLALEGLLEQREVRHDLLVAAVHDDLCGGCGTCVKTCVFHAARIDATRRISVTEIERCVGCGNCVTACPTGARDQASAPTMYLFESVDILASFRPAHQAKVLYLLCEGCGYPALDGAASSGAQYPTGILPLAVSCGARIDTQLILQALHAGFDGVAIGICEEGHCRNIVGNVDLGRRVDLFRTVLRSRGIDPERLRVLRLTQSDSAASAAQAVQFASDLAEMQGIGL
ncbi:MAG: hydrogenase iron-sulfur subunit [Myxococcota bacterium]